MGQALYRKYRSKRLDDVLGQSHITTTLANAIKQGRISHAYLLTGPRGVGKTSIARIMAHEVNGLPYDGSNHIDIIEIDAASNRRIDEIREIREKVHSAPAQAKYKVYIIDEVHMLTKEAFNALLKTLEEPPEHAIFILATTEAHKLPETIVSRTQRFTFKPIEPGDAKVHLQNIAKQENIKIDDSALDLIIEHGDGSFRDSINLLEQASNGADEVTRDSVETLLGIASQIMIDDILAALAQGTAQDIVRLLLQTSDQGYQASQIASQLLKRLRHELLEDHLRLPVDETLTLMDELLSVPASPDPGGALEIALLGIVLKRSSTSLQAPTSIAAPEKIEAPTPPPVESQSKPVVTPPKTITGHLPDESTDTWLQVLQAIKSRHNTLYSFVRMARPEFSNDKLVLYFQFPFHQKRLAESKNQNMLQTILLETTGKSYKIKTLVDPTVSATVATEEPSTPNDALVTISNIFGDAEVLES